MNDASVIQQLKRDLQRLRAPEGYIRAGIPHFPGLFGRDSLIVAWQLLRYDPSIARATLVRLAQLQGKAIVPKRDEEPGKILHEYYERRQLRARLKKWRVVLRWGSPYYGSADATPLWLIVFDEYLCCTHDAATQKILWPHAVSAYRWIREIADHNRDGFLDYASHNAHALAHHSWKDSNEFGKILMPVAPVEVQGYAFAALTRFARRARERREAALADDAQRFASALREKFHDAFAQDGFFAFAIDGGGQRIPWITSNPGHLLFSGILDRETADRVAARMFDADFFTAYGVRTLSARDPNFDYQSYHRGSVWPHDNWFFWKGLLACGKYSQARRVRDALLAAYEALGQRITELYAVNPETNSIGTAIYAQGVPQEPGYPQAWASGALLDMLTYE